MNPEKRKLAAKIYLYLAALFITSLVVSNLIFQKFFYWYPFDGKIFGSRLFELSVGILVQNEQNKAFILEMTLIFVEKEYKGTLFIR